MSPLRIRVNLRPSCIVHYETSIMTIDTTQPNSKIVEDERSNTSFHVDWDWAQILPELVLTEESCQDVN